MDVLIFCAGIYLSACLSECNALINRLSDFAILNNFKLSAKLRLRGSTYTLYILQTSTYKASGVSRSTNQKKFFFYLRKKIRLYLQILAPIKQI